MSELTPEAASELGRVDLLAAWTLQREEIAALRAQVSEIEQVDADRETACKRADAIEENQSFMVNAWLDMVSTLIELGMRPDQSPQEFVRRVDAEINRMKDDRDELFKRIRALRDQFDELVDVLRSLPSPLDTLEWNAWLVRREAVLAKKGG